MLASPLEQFEILPLIRILVFGLDFSLTNAGMFCIFAVGSIMYVANRSLRKALYIIPTKVQVFYEMLYMFLADMIKTQVGLKGIKYMPFFSCAFLLILTLNVLGLMPFGFTVTSHIIITFFLALSFNLGFLFLGLAVHKIRFVLLFVPKGVPLLLAPLIIVIEIVSYLIRTFSLSLRLFANMMAGHTLLKILSSFVVACVAAGGYMVAAAFVPLLLVFAVTALEVGIAFLQAYVFTILLCIYANDAINLH